MRPPSPVKYGFFALLRVPQAFAGLIGHAQLGEQVLSNWASSSCFPSRGDRGIPLSLVEGTKRSCLCPEPRVSHNRAS
ncbi:uncharacterized protein EI90DRAFT_3065290 [Cantharellus anzutake]|uniref:uncharacterized protein n=1 Tax=Cantharellus anzutake TaxID=1750568 RepID=UPI001905713C|nr:uncharacterized protein EI90DRAFT_3065290 [Cantharellus anzutake]KAF8328435.1 hypothetical protein EI90DRAFT_3065290 [Cantharellus anzutake]